jgi:hypothetical protein
MYDMMYQMEMQKALNKVELRHSYKCFGGEFVTCFITMARMSGFSNVTAKIENHNHSKSKTLKVECLIPMSVTIQVGSSGWVLTYGDIITVNYDNGSSKTLAVGVDDGMSEIDWNRWNAGLIASAKAKGGNIVRPKPNIGNFNIPTNTISTPISQPSICQCCNGKRVSSTASIVAAFGDTETHWCNVCASEVSASHGPHLPCKCCNGTGYLK